MTRTARVRLTAVALVSVEVYFYARYAESGAEFHFWLHALLGGALGLVLLTLLRLWRRREARPLRAHEAGLAGHLVSAVPDVLFLVVGVLHAAWMDVFVLHITAHFLWPGPLPAALALWTLAVAAWTSVRLGARRVAQACLLASVAFLAAALILRDPLPRTLAEVREDGSGGSLGEQALDWVCRVEV